MVEEWRRGTHPQSREVGYHPYRPTASRTPQLVRLHFVRLVEVAVVILIAALLDFVAFLYFLR
jgi:hypothetical protein